jgi:hypothetical protein
MTTSSPVSSVAGQQVVGQYISVPWWDGSFEVTQGWGQTGYSGEPSGHGYPNWHAGCDVGAPCGTVIHLPSGIPTATIKHVDNPGGYGTALVVQISGTDIWLGHLLDRLAADGATVRSGDMLAHSNNTGNSTGCHIHFEVRPTGGAYGTDVDPTSMLLNPGGASGQNLNLLSNSTSGLSLPWDQVAASITTAEREFVNVAIGAGQIATGASFSLIGLVLATLGARGQSVPHLARAGAAIAGRAGRQAGRQAGRRAGAGIRPVRNGRDRRDSLPSPAATPQITEAARTRLNPDLQRRAPQPAPAPAPAPAGPRQVEGSSALGKLRAGADPRSLTPNEVRWAAAHPDSVRRALAARRPG